MSIEIEAVFENGVLKPRGLVGLREGTEVRLVIDPIVESPRGPEEDPRPAERSPGSKPGEPSLARQTYGLIGWKGDPSDLDRFALDPELDPLEGP